MRIVVFGLSISSSWGNGHATLWRALAHGLADLGHSLEFFERDAPYYAKHRDLAALPWGRLHIYRDWIDVRDAARRAVAEADAAIVTSYCPDGPAAAELVIAAARTKVFYDLDTPITLERLAAGESPDYLPRTGLDEFDLVLSFTGGASLAALRQQLGARRVAPLWGSVDPDVHRPCASRPDFGSADLSYLGTYAADRQAALESLLFAPARRRSDARFLVGGSMYPQGTQWPANVRRVPHVAPADHPSFYGAAPLTLSITRAPMAACGECPSGRLFEAAACGVPVVSDRWQGIERFFACGTEILIADGPDDVTAALDRSPEELATIGHAARERVLQCHTGRQRAADLVESIERAASATAPSPVLEEVAS
jgi:spore maturation protein CgeB